MPVIFKQTYNSLNLEFDDYLEVLLTLNAPDFCHEVDAFGRELIVYAVQIRLSEFSLPDFEKEVAAGKVHGSVLTIGRLSLLTAKMLEQSIEEKLGNDFPKFLGTKTNFWRYLLHLVSFFMSNVAHDYTKSFAVATACLIQLNFYCFRLGHLIEDCKTFFNAMFLHFFGERFQGKDKLQFLRDFDFTEHEALVRENEKKAEAAKMAERKEGEAQHKTRIVYKRSKKRRK